MSLNDAPLMFIHAAIVNYSQIIALVVGLCPKMVRESEYCKGNTSEPKKICADLLIGIVWTAYKCAHVTPAYLIKNSAIILYFVI